MYDASPSLRSSRRSTSSIELSFDCYVLTTGIRSRQSLPFACQYITAEPFSTQQWLKVDPAMRQEMNSGSRYGFFDLSNNNTVNIFHNHVQIWKRILQANRSALILEDDAVISPNNVPEIVQAIKSVSYLDSCVLKMHNLNSYQFHNLKFGQTSCVCKNILIPASLLAYYVTPPAASILVEHYIPIKTHVDLWIWQMACIEKKIYLLSSRNVAIENAAYSLHRNWLSNPFDSITWGILNGVSGLQESILYFRSSSYNKSHCPIPTQQI
jgi:hypothetical protein